MAYGNAAPNTTREATPVEAARDFANQLADLAMKVAAETDQQVGQLIGFRPSAVAPGRAEKDPPPSAVMDQIRAALNQIRDALEHVSSEVGRL